MNVQYLPNRQVTISGQVSNTSQLSEQIQITGAVKGTVTSNAQGFYSITLPVTQLGKVMVSDADPQSNIPSAVLVGAAPQITSFHAVCEGGGVWLFEGTVTGAPTQGEVVKLGGISACQDVTCKVNADGTFDEYVQINPGNGGLVSAQAVDWSGNTSQTARCFVTC
jgi:hypothetical protein